MCKKILFVGAVGLLTAALLTQTKLGSHAKAWMNRAEAKLESSIPDEHEVQRLKMEVAELNKEIELAKNDVAKEIVEAREQKAKVGTLAEQVKNSRTALDARYAIVKAAENEKDTHFVKFDGNKYDLVRAKQMLQDQVRTQVAVEKNLKSEETMLTVRERTRDLAEQHLKSLVSQKSELDAILTEMEADIKQLKIEQIESKYQNDGTKMADVKESIAKLKKRIAIQREKLNLAKTYDPASAQNKSADEIMAELNSATKDSVGKKGN
jgi:chromosome segregation ATPase